MAEKRYYAYATYMIDSDDSIEAIGLIIPDITKRSQGKELALIDVKVQEAPAQAQPGYIPPEEEYLDEEVVDEELQEQEQAPQKQTTPPQEQIQENAEQE